MSCACWSLGHCYHSFLLDCFAPAFASDLLCTAAHICLEQAICGQQMACLVLLLFSWSSRKFTRPVFGLLPSRTIPISQGCFLPMLNGLCCIMFESCARSICCAGRLDISVLCYSVQSNVFCPLWRWRDFWAVLITLLMLRFSHWNNASSERCGNS